MVTTVAGVEGIRTNGRQTASHATGEKWRAYKMFPTPSFKDLLSCRSLVLTTPSGHTDSVRIRRWSPSHLYVSACSFNSTIISNLEPLKPRLLQTPLHRSAGDRIASRLGAMKIAQGTALNRAWASYDIVATILEILAPGPILKPPLIYPADERLWIDQRRQNKIALSRVACVCRALSSIALDILWRNINSIFHLIHIVPSCYTLRAGSEDGIYEIVSTCTGSHASTPRTLTIDNAAWPSSRGSLGSHPRMNYVLSVPTQRGYESSSSHAPDCNMTVLLCCYIGSHRTSSSCHNCADWTGSSTGSFTKCHQTQRRS